MEGLKTRKKTEVFLTKEDRDALDEYKARIKEHKMISPEEEVALGKKIRLTKDEEAIKKLVESNLFFVIAVAKNYVNLGLPIMDLINEGNLGLMEAARRFDETKGFKFISYAVFWIRRNMLLALGKRDIVEPPVGKIHDVSKELDDLRQKYEQANFIDLSDDDAFSMFSEDLIEDYKIKDAKTLILAQNARRPHIQLDAPLLGNDEGGDRTMLETFEDKGVEMPTENISRELSEKELNNMLGQLSAQEREIIIRTYGLFGSITYGDTDIARDLGLSNGESVSAIRKKSLKKLKRNPTAKALFGELFEQ